MSAKREASVKRIRETPAVMSVVMKTDTGRNAQVAWRGKPVTIRIRTSGMIDRPRLTSPPPTADAMNTERGTNIRLASSLDAMVWEAAEDVVCAKKVQKMDPAMK